MTKQKNTLSLLATFLSVFAIVAGLIGNWYVLQYRIDKVEVSAEKIETVTRKMLQGTHKRISKEKEDVEKQIGSLEKRVSRMETLFMGGSK
jgi:hypothetical protein